MIKSKKTINTFKNIRLEHNLFKGRVFATLIVIGILSGTLVARLIYLQLFQHQHYTLLAQQNQLGLVPIEPSRGLIYDRFGSLLAENKPVFNLVLIPEKTSNLNKSISDLAKIIKIGSEDIKQFERQRRTHHRFEPIPLRLKLSEQEVAKFSIQRYRFPSATVSAQMIRHYPQGNFFTSVVGYVGRINEKELQNMSSVNNYSASNFIGKTGIEKYYETALHGKIGYQKIETNVHGQTVRTLKQAPPIPGKSLTLTIDSGLQKLAQQALGEQQGAVVAMDPRNGEILAFVSNPSFDPNLFVSGIKQADYANLQKATKNPLYNRALQGTYHPGSTIKPFISTGALMDGVITPHYTIHDSGEFQLNGKGRIYHNFRHHAYGQLNLLQALTVSSDIYFYNLSMRLGIQRLYSSLKKFGFGDPTGIDLANEASGLLPDPIWKKKYYGESWYPGDTLNCGIGQGFLLATPLQLVAATSMIANWGERWQPHLLLSWRSADGSITYVDPKPMPPLTLRADILRFIRTAMQRVVNAPGGTAQRFFMDAPYQVAGKTGTAQVYSLKDNERYNTNTVATSLRDNSLFIAFAPVEKPVIALAIVVQNSLTPAAQIARQLLDYYLLPNLKPMNTTEQSDSSEKTLDELPQTQISHSTTTHRSSPAITEQNDNEEDAEEQAQQEEAEMNADQEDETDEPE